MPLTALLALSTAQASIGGVAVTIQAEPHEGPADHWGDLVAAIAAADRHDIDLTILMSWSWARYTLASPLRMAQAARWITEGGHQIGFHHHDITSNNPAGICGVDEADWVRSWTRSDWASTCEPIYEADIGYGDVAELVATLQADYGVPSGPHTDANIACQGPEVDMRSFEWQDGVLFSQGNQPDGSNDPSVAGAGTLSGTGCQSYGGGDIPEIGSSWIYPGSSATQVADIIADLSDPTASPGDYISVTFHPEEYTGATRAVYDYLFRSIRSAAGGTLLMSEILVAEDPCGSFGDTGL